ncbi:YfiR family protein [Sphingomonas sanguinis]|uniref:YfiR/HmsC family protein n=1 Tax=Sphingomonas sanguinis TaxID=33051 RepID=UPI001C57BD67|nr:YfiR/HmsC family protein [Sphingomonas sanguinis]QXT35412.1 YfiR family protein [Sphingomonas sanguinis]
MSLRRKLFIAWASSVSVALPVSSAPSAVLNVPVAARIISFVQPAPVGNIPVAIIYQPGNAGSEAEASDMERALLHGGTFGRVTFRSRRVPVADLGQMSGARAAFVTSGLRSYQADVAAAASAQAILTITSDTSCVSAGRCVVGITEGNKTQIVVSREAARRNHIRFGSAFLMLVKEI